MIRNLKDYKEYIQEISKKNQPNKTIPSTYYNVIDKHNNEVSIILVITDDNLQSSEYDEKLIKMIKTNRKKSKTSSRESSEKRDRLNYFNLLCSLNESDASNLEEYNRLKKLLKKNLQNRTRTKKSKKKSQQDLTKVNDFNNTRQKSKRKINEIEYNIYGQVKSIPSNYSRPPLPPFCRNKFWSNPNKELVDQKESDNYFPSSIVTNFLYSKYDFEHSTSSCVSDSEESVRNVAPLHRNDSFEFKPSKEINNFSEDIKCLIRDNNIQVGDRPDKNLKIKNSYFKIHENDLPSSSLTSSSSSNYLNEDDAGYNSYFTQPIPRQNRIVFYELDSKEEDDDEIKYEANLPRLPEPNSQMLTITKRFEFNSNNSNKNIGLKYVRKKDIGNGLKSLNQTEVKNLSVIAEEEVISSSSSSSMCEEAEIRNLSAHELYSSSDANSIQKDIDLASESLSSATSSTSNSEDLNYMHEYLTNSETEVNCNLERNIDFISPYRINNQISFKSLYNNYFNLKEKFEFEKSDYPTKINEKGKFYYI